MKQKGHIQFKAAFLLFIFSLNMFVGTACALGVDMDFNPHHHEEETASTIPVHANGKQHHHEDAEHKHTSNDKKDNCCNDSVLKLLQTDKTVPQFTILINQTFFISFIPVYYSINITYAPQVSTSNKYYVSGHHPPIPDIRIAIQSFQI